MRTCAPSLSHCCGAGVLVFLMILVGGGAVSAQTEATETTQATDDAPSEAGDEGVEEDPADERVPDESTEIIQVLGTRRESLAQAEALSITAFDQASLDELGIQDVDSLQQFVPSLHIGQVGNSAVITLRGIGFDNLTVIGEPGVIFEVDGVPLSRPSSANSLFYDVENVQVLRGPQGTQGGRNSTAGRIAIASARPSPDFEAFGDTQIGSYSQIIQRGVVNIPLWDEYLMSRFNVLYNKRNGYQRNILPKYNDDEFRAGDANSLAVRGQLSSNATDNLRLRGIGTYSFQKGVGPAFKTIGPIFKDAEKCPDDGSPTTPVCPVSSLGGLDTIVNPADPRATSANVVGQRDNFQYGFTGRLDYDLPTLPGLSVLGDSSFAFIASWQVNVEENGGLDATDERGIDLDATNSITAWVDTGQDAFQRSFELYLESRDAAEIDWKFGFFNLSEEIESATLLGTFETPATLGTYSRASLQITQVETKTYAGYGQASFWLLDNLQVLGGIRYTRGTKSLLGRTVFGFNRNLDANGNPVVKGQTFEADVPKSKTWDAWTPKALLRWDVTDDSSLTISATRGFKLGGFSLPPLEQQTTDELEPSITNVRVYDPELVWSYELLSKNEFDSETFGALTLNLSLFWVDYSSYQACLITTDGFQCDVGNARTRGVELEANWAPIPPLRFNAVFNYLDSEVQNLRIADPTERSKIPKPSDPSETVDNPLSPTIVQDVSGNQLTKAPTFSLTLGSQYEFELAEYGLFGFLTPRFQFRFQDRTFYRVFNLEKFSQEPFFMIDFKLTWRSEDDRLSLEGFVNNITDTNVINSILVGTPAIGAPVLAQYLPPRVFGLRIGYRY